MVVARTPRSKEQRQEDYRKHRDKIACRSCNARKNARPLERFLEQLNSENGSDNDDPAGEDAA